MAILKQGSTTLNSGAKGDMPSFTINSTPVIDGSEIIIAGGSGGDTRTVPITTQSELINVANANKVMSIQANITLNADITIPDGAILEYGGGTIDVNGFKVLFQNNSFGKMNIDDKLFDFSYFGTATQGFTAVGDELNWTLDVIADWRFPVTTTVNGNPSVHYFDPSIIDKSNQNIDFKEMENGSVSDIINDAPLTAGDVIVVTYTAWDDFSRIDADSTFNIDFIWAKWFGLTDHVDASFFDNKSVFDNALIAARGATLYVNKGHYYKSIVEWNPNAIFPGAPNFRPREGGLIVGNTHVIGMGKTDTRISMITNHGVIKGAGFLIDGATGGSFQNIWMEGDFLTTLNQNNEHKWALQLEGNSDDFLIKGNRLSYFTADGIHSAPSGDFAADNFSYENGDIDDTGVNIDSNYGTNSRSLLYQITPTALAIGHGMLTNGGYAGYGNLVSVSVRVFFYKANGDFISKTNYVMTYKDIRIPKDELGNYATHMRIVIPVTTDNELPIGLKFRGSNHSLRVQVRDNEIDHNFRNGISNLPAQGIIDGNYIYQNGGRPAGPNYGIDLEDGYQELNDITISNNVFEDNYLGAITLRWVRDINIFNNKFIAYDGTEGINARETWATRIYNNKMYSTKVQCGRQTIFESNELYDSDISLPNSQSKAVNNIFFDSIFKAYEVDKPDSSILENNTFYFQRPVMSAIGGSFISRNNEVILRGNHDYHENWFQEPGDETGADDVPRSMDNFKLRGTYIPSVLYGIKLTYQPIKNSSFNMPLILKGGRPVSPTLRDNEYTGFIQFGYTGDVGVGRTVSIIGGVLNTSTLYGSNTFAYCALKSIELDINLYFEDFTINATDKDSKRILFFTHTGTTVFKNCTFNNDTDAFDVNGDNSNLTTCPPIHFVDCTMPTTTTLRTGDKIRFTKPHPDLPVYADNATAIADDYNVVGDVYRTATGEYKIVYTP